MPSQREDYLLRLIRQVAEALRHLREALLGEADPSEVAREAADAIGQLLGPRSQLLSSLDARSAAALLADTRRVALWADLLRVEAAAHRKLGDSASAGILEKRAEDLERAAQPAGDSGST